MCVFWGVFRPVSTWDLTSTFRVVLIEVHSKVVGHLQVRHKENTVLSLHWEANQSKHGPRLHSSFLQIESKYSASKVNITSPLGRQTALTGAGTSWCHSLMQQRQTALWCCIKQRLVKSRLIPSQTDQTQNNDLDQTKYITFHHQDTDTSNAVLNSFFFDSAFLFLNLRMTWMFGEIRINRINMISKHLYINTVDKSDKKLNQ